MQRTFPNMAAYEGVMWGSMGQDFARTKSELSRDGKPSNTGTPRMLSKKL